MKHETLTFFSLYHLPLSPLHTGLGNTAGSVGCHAVPTWGTSPGWGVELLHSPPDFAFLKAMKMHCWRRNAQVPLNHVSSSWKMKVSRATVFLILNLRPAIYPISTSRSFPLIFTAARIIWCKVTCYWSNNRLSFFFLFSHTLVKDLQKQDKIVVVLGSEKTNCLTLCIERKMGI